MTTSNVGVINLHVTLGMCRDSIIGIYLLDIALFYRVY